MIHQGSLFLVGDPKQSLYQWRGASQKFLNLIIEKKPPFYTTYNLFS